MRIWETIEVLKELHKDNGTLLRGIKEIENQLEWLNCLECAGVDNWSGYEVALEMMEEDDEEYFY